jgi:hypothetical protein
MTLIQTGKADLMPLVLVDSPGGTYWQHWRTWVASWWRPAWRGRLHGRQ